MKIVSNEYKAAQKSNLIHPVRKIELFRRFSDGSGWETSPIDVTSELVNLDRLSWKLDTDALNEFKASNIRLEAENCDRQWDKGSSLRFAGFLRFHSKIRISLGLKIGNVDEIFPAWTGVIEDVLEDSDEPIVQLELKSADQILEDADANKAAVQVTNELLGIGDGIRSEFELSQTPVGEVKEVRVAGEVMRPGTRWSVSNLNDPQKKAIVKFETVQPESGTEVRADYVVWKRDRQIHDVANDLLDSVPQVQKLLVETVHFDPPAQREILHTHIGDFAPYSLHRATLIPEDEPPEGDGQLTIDAYDSETKWQTAIDVSRINFRRIKGGIHPLWTSQYEADYAPSEEKAIVEGDYTFPWSELLPTGSSASLADSIRTITHNAGADYMLYNQVEEFGLSRCICARIRFTSLPGTVTLGTRVGQSPFLGAQIEFINVFQVRVRSATVSASYFVNLSQFHVFRLALTLTSVSSGTWALFIDGVQVLSGALGTLAGGTTGVRLQSSTFATNTFYIDYLRYNGVSPNPVTGHLVLKVDYGVQLSGLTTFGVINTLGPFFAELQGMASGSQFFYSWSADDITYSSETSVPNSGNVGDWTNVHSPRYVKFRIVITDTLESLPYGIKRLWLPAIATSAPIDGGTGIVSWDKWKAGVLQNDGNVKRFTAVATSLAPSGYSFHQALGPDDTIISDDLSVSQGFGMPPKMVFITLMNTAGINPPMHGLSIITLITKDVLITMANFSSRSVLNVIKELAKIADFEIGLDGEGKFFFRNKSFSSSPVMTLDGSNVEKVNSISTGWDRIYNSVRASFGQFVKAADSLTENEPAPTSNQRFGIRPLSIGGGSLIFQTDVDLATVMAKRYFNRYKEPKQRVTLTARFMPELELGDRVGFNVSIPRQIGQAFDARVLGIAHDLMNFRTEIDLMEI